ncbi:RHS repeat-associated protein [Pseudomonas lini]|uniref:RHS repeat-associated core domain-containing protein n=1 Tax=Pseudomonas lini TaxID=163011 RepID=UPI00277F20FC|nr:RHS repeat-associated core domain-containing protein [Pseudomonas lini]MDQ0127099.1 RHS repeat-associated protein [Pseudomonas lini]
MLASDDKNSVLCEAGPGLVNDFAYSAYGHRSGEHPASTHLGYNGELREAQTGWYVLGNGHRAFNPLLMRFHSPDSWSPFGDGGLNAYSYTMGDPINYTDPSGNSKLAVLFGVLMNSGDDVMRGSRAMAQSSRGVSSLASGGTSYTPGLVSLEEFLSQYTVYTGSSSGLSVPTQVPAGLPRSTGPHGVPSRSSQFASPATPGSSRGPDLSRQLTFAPEERVVPRVKEAPKAQPVPNIAKAPKEVTVKKYNKMNVFEREAYEKRGGIVPEGGKLHAGPKRTALDVRRPDRDKYKYND